MDARKGSTEAGLPALSAGCALFLDIDGTLLDIAPTPDAVMIPDDLPPLLEEASAALGGALALVSGRPIGWIDRAFAPIRLAAAGQHGAEIRLHRGDTVSGLIAPPNLELLRAELPQLLQAMPGVLVEDKGIAIALHYRASPERGHDLRVWLESLLQELGGELHLLAGKMVFEIKAKAAWKERAVEIFMEVPPFAGRTPVFIGDDHTDEGAFVAVRRRGGRAIQVGPARSEHMTGWVDSPSAVRDWLAAVPALLRSGATS